MKVSIENLTLAYGKNTVVRDLDLEIADGESLVLLGQSGCGKTSTMRCVAGLESPNEGRITIGNNVMHDSSSGRTVPPNKRNVGMVFQSYAVWPHRTVFENVAFSLQMQKVGKDELVSRVYETLDLVGLRELAERGASLLSGGQMQRVALARSLVMRPNVLLLDEPLSNLDARLRERLRMELRELQLRLGLTTIYVTHDQVEAFALADRIALMQNGRIVQSGAPDQIYTAPASGSIAEFLGVGNLFACSPTPGMSGAVTLTDHDFTVRIDATVPDNADRLLVCLRPEDMTVTPVHDEPATGVGWAGRVDVASYQGASIRYRITLDGGPNIEALATGAAKRALHVGERVAVDITPGAAQLLVDDRTQLVGAHS
ncbi:ABC transporter ATP-binding protein [Rhodococcus sp. 05-2255-3B1]|uniref:ABC transporter ATP-binding protein n=1 Tax=unclassified Rhodococcus (in: high G+C Gram-positive bacteria) TaxID=192944 RepID=UPI000B9ADE9A|nr:MULTISPECIES: ABC transporter ATP-binding protein [unclassified Rhodococcus (in: high G+C Gram-positive bacteria)]OZE08799.1 ABC transporter ATP-binding protein [Rhodococcus sp. 05-2255-3B1]OZE10139.1 ABC transporter ATP-binding protein [Rhodococcus sp. 05-2255-3C]OZE25260.1 ABC transporter ATP-binding protein [Rhodococcus sp. 05-2255-2A2]